MCIINHYFWPFLHFLGFYWRWASHYIFWGRILLLWMEKNRNCIVVASHQELRVMAYLSRARISGRGGRTNLGNKHYFRCHRSRPQRAGRTTCGAPELELGDNQSHAKVILNEIYKSWINISFSSLLTADLESCLIHHWNQWNRLVVVVVGRHQRFGKFLVVGKCETPFARFGG